MIKRKAFISFGTFIALFMVAFVLQTSVFAAPISPFKRFSSTGFVDFVSLQKTCSVIDVQLSGVRHTISCRIARTSAQNTSVRPLISRDYPCNLYQDTLGLQNYGYNPSTGHYNGTLCFAGTGYLGVNIYDVNSVNSLTYAQPPPGNLSFWFRWYHSGGHFCGGNAGQTYTFDNLYGTGITGVEVTQINVGSNNGYHDCPY